MALIDKTAREYYEGVDGVQNSGDENYGNYQFTSLDTIISQFIIAYVGENKIISKIKRTDVSFHAQRALQELSFDTLKSFKSFEYVIPPSLQMPLPQDYVNYTKMSWVDESGIKHIIYPVSKTSNPVAYQQNTDGSFKFETNSYIRKTAGGGQEIVTYTSTNPVNEEGNPIDPEVIETITYTPIIPASNQYEEYGITQSGLQTSRDGVGDIKSNNLLPKFVKETRIAVTNSSGYLSKELSYGPASAMQMNFFNAGHDIEVGMTIFAPGILPNTTVAAVGSSTSSSNFPGMGITMTNPVYEQWLLDGSGSDDNGYPYDTQILGEEVIFVDLNKQSSTWPKYKTHTPSANSNSHDDYKDDTYWPNEGGRYGLDPQHAQVNGSYYIDSNSGLIHFSSNISGKTVILDYVSDSLGTDAEMQVHKLAEEAMYKCIAYAIMSTRANVQEYIVRRFQKDKFAAVRKAKLRLSNLKIEELTQILRGKSKQIKH